jgi:hypothetical protein
VLGAAAYLGLALDLRAGTTGVEPAGAASASGLLTTTFQLSQAVGVATFGSLFLTLAADRGPHGSAHER